MIKNNSVVGIDIDCVLTKLEPTIEHMAEYFNKPVAKLKDVTDYNLSEAYGVSDEETLEFWKEEERYLCETAVLAKGRVETIYDLIVDKDTSVVIVTSRSKEYVEETSKWLEDNEIKHDMLVMTSGECKKPIIDYFGFDYMVDDKPELFHAMEGSDTTMICVDYEYNKSAPAVIRLDQDNNIYYGKEQ